MKPSTIATAMLTAVSFESAEQPVEYVRGKLVVADGGPAD